MLAVGGGKRIYRKLVRLALIAVSLAALVWVAHYRPASKRLYTQGLDEYKAGEYKRSLSTLAEAHRYNPLNTSILMLLGQNHLATGNYVEARRFLSRALRVNSELDEARLGLAYACLEMGDNSAALEYFNQLAGELRGSHRVRVAMTRAYRQRGDNRAALRMAREVLEEDPSDELAVRELAFLTGAEDLETLAAIPPPSRERPSDLVVAARLRDGYFHLLDGGVWKQLYLHGVNIGPATPGRFASEPPIQMSVYVDWLDQIAALGANCVRVYTLLPPAFYRALLTHNTRHPERRIYLFQEIWLKDAPLDNLFDKEFTADFKNECRVVVDAIHGQADVQLQRGHASGIFAADVSPYVLGWLVGREIEPHVVITTNLRNPGVKTFEGRYLKINGGSPAEVWLAGMCDAIVEYEVMQYNWQRPVAFVNWPPLDPLSHPTEARLVDEIRMRTAMGEKLAPLGLGVQDDVDVVALDEEKIAPQPGFQAGYFALYHVYPFWPDFLILTPAYREARDTEGLNAYWGYLQDLKKHYKRTPVVIGEYGMSTSTGIAHFHPNGWNHGGLSEMEQGHVVARLSQNIQEAGFAGGIIFEWIDEWWKHNWIADDFEKPVDRTPFWHNDMNPEQSFGLMKFTPQGFLIYTPLNPPEDHAGAVVTEKPALRPPLVDSIRTASDASALYIDLVLDLPPGAQPDWAVDRYLLALNTCDVPCGSETLPYVADTRVAEGANFVVNFTGSEMSRLLVARSYNPYRILPVEGVPALTELTIPRNLRAGLERPGAFEELIIETNRRRFGRDGTQYPAMRYSRSILRYGNFDPTAENYDSLAQCYFDAVTGRVRLRLSWGLLMVLDPSQGLVLSGTDEAGKTLGTLARNIRVAAIAYKVQGDAAAVPPAQIMAKRVSGNAIVESWSMPWPTWTTVSFWTGPKQSYAIIRDALVNPAASPGRNDEAKKSHLRP